MSKITAYTEHTTPSGDNDDLVIVDNSGTPTTKKVKAKNATGGMLAHGDAVKAFYNISEIAAGASYHKIASLPINISGQLVLDVTLGGRPAASRSTMQIHIGNRVTTPFERVINLVSPDRTYLPYAGIRTYVETDNSLSVYLYFQGTQNVSIGCTLNSVGISQETLATIIPPNNVVGIIDPTAAGGTLSLDTTAAPYKDGVPDGNEDWKGLTLVNGWNDAANTARYRRHANGLVEVYFRTGTVYGTLTDGTTLFTLPAGYRHVSPGEIPMNVLGQGGTNGQVCSLLITSLGECKIYFSISAPIAIRSHSTFMAEA